MKALLSLIISGALVVSGYSQTRNVLVGTNNAVVQPTNFWSADSSNARTGLGLGTAATNPSSAFQPASSILSNLVSGGSLNFTNITVGISNVTGLQSALDGKLSTNPTLFIANISNLQTTLDGKLGINPTLQISNIAALQTALDGKLSGTFPIAISNVSGLQASLDGKLGTNPALSISNISGLQTNLDSKLSITGNASGLTNIQASSIVGIIPASNISTVTLSNITGTLPIAQGGTGSTNQAGARTALGIGASDVFVGLTNLGVGSNQGFASSPYILGSTNSIAPNNAVLALDASGVRLVAGLTLSALTNVDNASFRTAIGLSSAATNPASAFQPSSSVLSNLASSNAINLTNLQASNMIGAIAISNGGSGATSADAARTNLGLGATNNVTFDTVTTEELYYLTNSIISLVNKELYSDGVAVLAWNTNTVEINAPILLGNSNAIAATRTNLGLGWPALTNTTASGFQAALFGTGTNAVLVNTNGEVVSPTNFWQAAPITTTFIESQPTTNSSTNITSSRFLHIHSLFTNIINVTNTIILPTNGSTFEGDMAMVVHKGPTNSTTQVRQAGSTNNLITLGKFNEAVDLTFYNNSWQLLETVAFTDPIYFSGTNASNNAAASRTNLGLGATWLTNTNITNFRTAIGLGATNAASFQSVITEVMAVGSGTNSYFSADVNMVETALSIEFANNSAAATRTNLGLGATWLTNTNVTNFRTAIGLGATNYVEFGGLTLGGQFEMADGQTFYVDGEIGIDAIFTFSSDIRFLFPSVAATTRTNLGLGFSALTNTSVTNFQKAIFYTNTAPSNIGGNLGTIAAWIEIVASNGVTYKVPAYTNVP